MDISGEHHLDVLHSVYKIRLSADGTPIQEEAVQYELGASQEEEEELNENGEKKQKDTVIKKEEECGRYLV